MAIGIRRAAGIKAGWCIGLDVQHERGLSGRAVHEQVRNAARKHDRFNNGRVEIVSKGDSLFVDLADYFEREVRAGFKRAVKEARRGQVVGLAAAVVLGAVPLGVVSAVAVLSTL